MFIDRIERVKILESPVGKNCQSAVITNRENSSNTLTDAVRTILATLYLCVVHVTLTRIQTRIFLRSQRSVEHLNEFENLLAAAIGVKLYVTASLVK